MIDGEDSQEAPVTSGVPQGSVIGPAMFLFYINDLPDTLKSSIRLFADDTIAYNSASNHSTLQDDLNKLELWEQQWDMEFHPSKCQHIVFSRKRQPTDKVLNLHGTEIPKANDIKYLGVTLDPKLNWNKHIDNVTAKGNSTLGFIRRNVLTSSETVKNTAYKQLVRPVLEYASASWDSVSDTAASRLEAVQRRAARLICGIRRTDRKTSTTSLLQKLDLQPLNERRSDRRKRYLVSITTPAKRSLATIFREPASLQLADTQRSTLFHNLTPFTTKDLSLFVLQRNGTLCQQIAHFSHLRVSSPQKLFNCQNCC